MDTYEERLPIWVEIYGYGIKHPIPISVYEETAKRMGMSEDMKRLELPSYIGSYEILPAWTEMLEKLRRPFNTAHCLDYWRTGKAMIFEEMPEFFELPEWKITGVGTTRPEPNLGLCNTPFSKTFWPRCTRSLAPITDGKVKSRLQNDLGKMD